MNGKMTPQEVIDGLRRGGNTGKTSLNDGMKSQADEFPPQTHLDEMGLKRDDPLCAFADKLIWGTYGRPAQLPVKYKFLHELDTEHLQNILATQRQIPVIYSRTIMFLLNQRSERKGWKRRGAGTIRQRIWRFLNAL